MGVYAPEINPSKKKVWAWFNSSRKAPLGNHRKIKKGCQLDMYLINRNDHANQWRFTNLNQNENMPLYGIRCVVGRKKTNDTQSSITKCVILVIHVHRWIRSTYQKMSLRRRSMRTSKYQKVWAWLNGLKEAPLRDHDKLTNRSSSRCVSRKWKWSCNSMKIYKSQPKGKYATVWHQMFGR